MKNSTSTVVCSFAALIYFITITPMALMWMDKNSNNNLWFWEPMTQSQIWASRLIFWEVMAIAFNIPLTLLTLALIAWRASQNEHPMYPGPQPTIPGMRLARTTPLYASKPQQPSRTNR